MKHIYLCPLIMLVIGCASSKKDNTQQDPAAQKYPAVTIETSGDLYYEENGDNVQIDLFGSCAPGQKMVYVEVDRKKRVAPCKNDRYRYSLNLPPSFFEGPGKDKRLPSSQYVMKEITAYHHQHKKLKATSYILIDRKRREVKSVINKQVRFEKIPTGEFAPVTQYNAFGSCTRGATITIDVVSPDRFGHMVSKYDEKKKCENAGGYYFLSQIHGLPKKGTQFKVYEDMPVVQTRRQPASANGKKVRFKNLFNWTMPIQ